MCLIVLKVKHKKVEGDSWHWEVAQGGMIGRSFKTCGSNAEPLRVVQEADSMSRYLSRIGIDV